MSRGARREEKRGSKVGGRSKTKTQGTTGQPSLGNQMWDSAGGDNSSKRWGHAVPSRPFLSVQGRLAGSCDGDSHVLILQTACARGARCAAECAVPPPRIQAPLGWLDARRSATMQARAPEAHSRDDEIWREFAVWHCVSCRRDCRC